MDLRNAALLALSLVMLGGCRLTVDVSGEGTVTSDNGKINCPADCKAKLKKGKEIILTATAASTESFFASWKGCEEESGTQCIVVGTTKNRRVSAVFAEDKTLEESGLSTDLRNCATTSPNDIALTAKLSSVTELECEVVTSASFSVEGIGELANLEKLIITDVGGGIDSLGDITDLTKLETLVLNRVGLTDVSALSELNEAPLLSLNLDENPLLECTDVEQLETAFPNKVSASSCETTGF